MKSEGQAKATGSWVSKLLITAALVFFASGFLHPRADFPNGSPWMDWSKMTDEGWYGGGAIHHFVWGHWYLADSFNPAVAMPVWPVMLAGWFAATGVSMIAARVLTMVLYGISLWLLFVVVRRGTSGASVWAALAVALTALNPFCWAFNRVAVLEPVTVFWMMLGFWMAPRARRDGLLWQVLLGVVLAMLVLTKSTGVALVPGVLYLMLFDENAGGSWVPRLKAAVLPVMTLALVWLGYLQLFVRPRYQADYRLLFLVNDYRVHLSIVPQMAWVTLRDGMWIQPGLWLAVGGVLLLSVVWLRELWQQPLFGAAVLAMLGHLAYVGYHTNFQPRYYLVIAMPMAMVLVLGLRAICARALMWPKLVGRAAMAVALVMMAVGTWKYIVGPEYSFLVAAQGIATVVESDGGPSPVLLSDSGDDITLLTGLRAVPERYAVHGLDAMLQRYHPEWYAAWLGWEDDAIREVGKRYTMQEVARYWVFDDPKRQVLVLYKLTPHAGQQGAPDQKGVRETSGSR